MIGQLGYGKGRQGSHLVRAAAGHTGIRSGQKRVRTGQESGLVALGSGQVREESGQESGLVAPGSGHVGVKVNVYWVLTGYCALGWSTGYLGDTRSA